MLLLDRDRPHAGRTAAAEPEALIEQARRRTRRRRLRAAVGAVEIERPLFCEREWRRLPLSLPYFGQVDWTGQFSWWSPQAAGASATAAPLPSVTR